MAASKITVELLADMANIGRKGDIIEMSSGQARNSIIPKGLAREVTAERLKKIENDEKKAKDQARMRLLQAFEIQTKLEGQVFEFTLKGKGGKVFGGLGEHEIGARVREKFGIDFEKRDIRLPNKTHLKTAGTHLVYLHITRDTLAKIIVEIKIES